MSEALKQRVITAIIIGIPILFLVFFNDITRTIFLSLILLLCSYEFNSLQYKNADNKFVFLLPSILISIVILFISIKGIIDPNLFIYLGIIGGILLLLDLLFLKINLLSKSSWVTSIMYTSIPLVSLIALSKESYFSILLIGILLMIWVSDIGAYTVGKNIGKRKLMPSVSPGKSWEGFIGAGVISVLASILFYKLLGHYSLNEWMIIACIIWLFGSLGDLVESQMKRHIGVKDSGTILPGHGGFLDRFDGFYFCIPFVLFYTQIILN